MRGGRLRHRVVIQAPSDERDAHGGNTRSWSEVDTVYADVVPLSGRELYEARQVEPRATVSIRIRHMTGLDESYRVVYTE